MLNDTPTPSSSGKAMILAKFSGNGTATGTAAENVTQAGGIGGAGGRRGWIGGRGGTAGNNGSP